MGTWDNLLAKTLGASIQVIYLGTLAGKTALAETGIATVA